MAVDVVTIQLRLIDEVSGGVTKAEGTIRGLSAATKESSAASREAADSHGAMGKALSGVGGVVDSVMAQLKGLAGTAGLLAIPASIGAVISGATSLQSNMTMLATQAGYTHAQVSQLTPAVEALAGQVGFSPTSLAQGLYHIASAGVPASQSLEYLTKAAELAKVGNAGLEETTQAVIGTMAAFGSEGMTADKAVGLLNLTVGMGDMRMQKLAQSIATGVLPTFANAGLTMNDYSAALATLTDNVTPADTAATRLRTTIQMMQAPSGVAAKNLQELGFNSTKLAGDLRKPDGLLLAVGDIRSHFGDLVKTMGQDNAEQALLKSFGGSRSASYIIELIHEFDRLQGKYDTINSANPAQRFADSWATTKTTFKQQAAQIEGSLQSLADRIGMKLLPVLGQALGGLQGVLAHGDSVAGGAFATARSAVGAYKTASAPGPGGAPAPRFAGADAASGVLGINPMILRGVQTGLADVRDIFTDLQRIADSLAPAVITIAKYLGAAAGGALLGALTVLKDVLGFVADHATATKLVLAGLIAVMATKAAIGGITDGLNAVAKGALEMGSAIEKGPQLINNLTKAWGDARAGVSLLAGAIRDSAAAQKLAAAATKAWEVVQAAFNIVMDANPIVLVTLAVLAIGVAVFEAYKHFRPFHDLVDAVGRFLRDVFLSVLHQVKAHLDLLALGFAVLLGPIGLAVAVVIEIVHHFGLLKKIASDVWDVIAGGAKIIFKILQVVATVVGVLLVLPFRLAWLAIDWVWQQIRGSVETAWNVIVGFLGAGLHFLLGIWRSVWAVISGAAEAVWDRIHAVITIAWSIIKGFLMAELHGLENLWNLAWGAVTAVVSAVWDRISAVINIAWSIIKGFLMAELHGLEHLWEAAWGAVTAVVEWVWDHISGGFETFWGKLQEGFRVAVAILSGLWDGIKKAFAEPINWVIKYVYDDGIVDTWNMVSEFTGAKKLARVDPLKFADGGHVPGRGDTDSVRALLMPGEFVLNRSATQAIGHDQLNAWNGGAQRFKDGGGVFGAIGDLAGSAWGGIKDAAGFAANVARQGAGAAAAAVLEPLKALIDHTLGTGTGLKANVSGFADKTIDSVLGFIRGHDSSSAAGGGTIGPPGDAVARWAPIIGHVLSELGQPQSLLAAVEQLIKFESGGNPRAINLTDSNALAGNPSQGLTQTIPSTFAAFAGPHLAAGILDPEASVYAGLNYGMHRYGAIANIPGIKSVMAGGPYVPYDIGGYLEPGINLAYNGTGRREPVMPEDVMVAAIRREMIGSGGGGQASGGGIVMQAGAVQIHVLNGMDHDAVVAASLQGMQSWLRDRDERS